MVRASSSAWSTAANARRLRGFVHARAVASATRMRSSGAGASAASVVQVSARLMRSPCMKRLIACSQVAPIVSAQSFMSARIAQAIASAALAVSSSTSRFHASTRTVPAWRVCQCWSYNAPSASAWRRRSGASSPAASNCSSASARGDASRR